MIHAVALKWTDPATVAVTFMAVAELSVDIGMWPKKDVEAPVAVVPKEPDVAASGTVAVIDVPWLFL